MTKLRKLEITLNNPQVVYFPGQVIQGQVIIELSDDMNMRDIHISCEGKGHVEWSEGDDSYWQSERYLHTVLMLYESSASSDDVTLQAGNHLFPFQFVLPVNLPGSFEGKSRCYVRYWLKATIDRPWKFDPEYKMLFTVGSVLDLNTEPNALAPAQVSDSKTVCCCCCESQPITATFRIDRSGYVPGESISCNAEIQEGTGRGVHSSKIKLVRLAVDVLDTPFDLKLQLPVIIGTIPLQSVVNQYMPQIQPGTITNQPMGFSAPVNFDLPPPAYHECVFGKVDTTDDDDKNAAGNMNFAPSYTYYDWMSPPPPSAPQN
ncbi:arrestin domain-containing protein 17-like isoform X3 [Mercenaria mercenaria]|uniref:arrestin domain-containing protein 17-like isoform X3 n=1 Tax=Mercenaria mercenaria TaxID=6596 RepID=UPI00234E40BE|nr:arrestin domain-containing protein 17-like isoform X3 [Mercenaria mercenaria]